MQTLPLTINYILIIKLLTLTVYFWYKNNPGTKTNLYDPYAMGYRRAAQATPMWYKIVRSS